MTTRAVLRLGGRPSSRPRRAAALALAAAAATIAAAAATSIRYEVRGQSMSPTLQPGDFLIASRMGYTFRSPSRGDVVIVRDPERPERELVKRVFARDERGVVVLGDDPRASRDSRHFGPVARDGVVGKVWLRYWPPRRIGRVR